MRLHSDFHDYYDNAIGYGIDDKVHYNRYTKSVAIDLQSHLTRPFHRNSGLIGFCGQSYPFIELHKYDRNFQEEDEWGDYNIVETRFAFDIGEYQQIEKEWSNFSVDFHTYFQSTDLKIKQFYLDWAINSDAIFLRHKVPVWAMKFYTEETNGILNPRLKDYGFDKIRDSFTTFQEISMYLSNILVEQKEIIIMDDKLKIAQHGFDPKISFRNTKKK